MPGATTRAERSIFGNDQDYLPILIEGLSSKDWEARMWASRDLTHVGERARTAVRLLLQAVNHGDPFVRGVALSLLGTLKLERAEAMAAGC